VRTVARIAIPTALAAVLLSTAVDADAHGLVGRQDLPIPRLFFVWGAFLVLVVSFVALVALWQEPGLEGRPERRLARVPRVLDPIAGALGVAAFAGIVYAGLAGSQTATANIAPTTVYVLFWVGIPVLSLLFGDVFRAFNPWRAIGRAAGALAVRVAGTREALPEPLEYPERLGRWPAAFGILAFAWVELVLADGDDPSVLAILALIYAAVQLVGMALYGVERWTERADAFAVLFGLYGQLSPLHWRDGAVYARRPLAGVANGTSVAGTVALLCVLIGTTSFDGFTGSALWSDTVPGLQTFFTDVGLGPERAIEAAFTVGLLAAVLVVSAFYAIGTAGMRTAARRRGHGELARLFAHSLVPIALAYVIAHYFSLLVYQGQAVGYLASDPLGNGSDLLGTASATIDYSVVSANGIWYVQVAALVLGHAAGLALSHERAIVQFGDPRSALRSQMWMLLVMVSFTMLGMWILSAGAQ
jgi:hypothetical protein